MPTIKIGDYIKIGTYYGDPIMWRCIDIDENGPLMISNEILTLKPFDATGKHKYLDGTAQNGSNRTNLGSNLWETSNMRAWLNSTSTAGNVVWLDGCPPNSTNVWDGKNAYAGEKGFLADGNFTENERNVIKSVSQKSLLNGVDATKLKIGGTEEHLYSQYSQIVLTNYDNAYYYNVFDKIFLLDIKQFMRLYQNDNKLGGRNYHYGYKTLKSRVNSEIKLPDPTYYWLRTPCAESKDTYSLSNVRTVGAGSGVGSDDAYDAHIGVRPAFYLNILSAIYKSGNGAFETPYILKD